MAGATLSAIAQRSLLALVLAAASVWLVHFAILDLRGENPYRGEGEDPMGVVTLRYWELAAEATVDQWLVFLLPVYEPPRDQGSVRARLAMASRGLRAGLRSSLTTCV